MNFCNSLCLVGIIAASLADFAMADFVIDGSLPMGNITRNGEPVAYWNYPTFTLLKDITESVTVGWVIVDIEGNGHSITGSGSGCGICMDWIEVIGIRDVAIRNFDRAISVSRTNWVTVENCLLEGNTIGLDLLGSSAHFEPAITHNVIKDNDYGIALKGLTKDGIPYDTTDNIISYNIIEDNRYGIYLGDSSDRNTISHNLISENNWGAYFELQSTNNIVEGNTFMSNINAAVTFKSDSTDNTVFNNNFLGTAHIVSDTSSNSYRSLDAIEPNGNYFEGWSTPDGDADGYVDGSDAYDVLALNGVETAVDVPTLTSPIGPVIEEFECPVVATIVKALAAERSVFGFTVSDAEYNIDGGHWMPMDAADGGFNSYEEYISIDLVPPSSTTSIEMCIHAKNSIGYFGAPKCSQLIQDTTKPTALCQDMAVELNGDGKGAIDPEDVDAGSTDNCVINTIELSKDEFTCADLGLNDIVLTVKDASGNEATCNAQVTVEDNLQPNAVCQADVDNVQLEAGGAGTIALADINNGSTDNCGIDTMELSRYEFTCDDLGLNEIVLTVKDASGNEATCNAQVPVEDNLQPNAVCQADVDNVQLDAGGAGTIALANIDNGSTDNCGIDTMELSRYEFTCADLGLNEIVLTVKDGSNNFATCDAEVTVIDDVLPIASCRQDVIIELDGDGKGAIDDPRDLDNGSTDNCDPNLELTLSKTVFGCADLGQHQIVLNVTDASGNRASCPATVTVEDNVPPNAVCQDVTVNLDASGDGKIPPDQVNNGSYDNCDDASDLKLSLSETDFTCDDVGEKNVTLTVTDTRGKSAVCHAVVTVDPFGTKDIECNYAFGGFAASPEARRCAVFQNNGKLEIDSSFVFGNTCIGRFELKASGGNPVMNGGIILKDFSMLNHLADVKAATTEGYHTPAWEIDSNPGLLDTAYGVYTGVRDEIEHFITNMCEFIYDGNFKIEKKGIDLSGDDYSAVATGLGFSHNDNARRGLYCVDGDFEIKESTVKLPRSTVFAARGGKIQLYKAMIEASPGDVLFATIPDAERKVGDIMVEKTEANATFLGDKCEVKESVVLGIVIGGETEDLIIKYHSKVICKSMPDTTSMQCENVYRYWSDGDSDHCAVFQYGGKVEVDNSFVFGNVCTDGTSVVKAVVKVGGANPVINGDVIYHATSTTLDSEAKVEAATTQYVNALPMQSPDLLTEAYEGYKNVYDTIYETTKSGCEFTRTGNLKIEDDSQTVKLSDTGVATGLGFIHSSDKNNGVYCVSGDFEIKQTEVEFSEPAVLAAIGGKLKLEKVTLRSRPGDVLLVTFPDANGNVDDLVVKDSTVTTSLLASNGKIDVDGSKVHGQVIGKIGDVKVRHEAQVLGRSIVGYSPPTDDPSHRVLGNYIGRNHRLLRG